MKTVYRFMAAAIAAVMCAGVAAGEGISLTIDPQAVLEILPLAAEALEIQVRAAEREARHAAELRKKGIAEVPACGSERYVIDAPAFGGFSFDDWGDEKELVGLKKPERRNEGTVEQNVRAAIKYLSRKGFWASARPAAVHPKGFFDGWLRALQRYNGRRDRTDTDRGRFKNLTLPLAKICYNTRVFRDVGESRGTKQNMILYHASNVEVKKPMLVESNRMLDFGPGFYTTTNREQAIRFAKSVVAKRGGVPMLNVYEFDESAFANFLVRKFDSPSEAWLDFVAANRTGTYAGTRYDLIIGPVANDNVYATIGLYMQGFMSREATINELRVRKLYDQLVFAAPKTFNYLAHLRMEVL